jgi:hypothetical protein
MFYKAYIHMNLTYNHKLQIQHLEFMHLVLFIHWENKNYQQMLFTILLLLWKQSKKAY